MPGTISRPLAHALATPVVRTRARRWGVVAALLVAVLAIPAVIAARAVTPSEVPAPSVLRDRIAASADRPWSGYAESTAGLGLPRIPALSDLTTLLGGTTRMRAWYAAPDRQRVDQLDATGERDRYVTPQGQAVWDYGATLLTLVRRDPTVRLPRPDDLLPPQLGRRLLSGTDPADPVTALPARRVAGVDAPGIRVTVQDPRTTVGALDLWADPATGVPLAVAVAAKGAGGPVLSTAFLEFDPTPPDPAVLEPRRGPGAGLTRSPTSDLFGVLGRGDPRVLPTTVDGVARERPQRGFGAIGQYGTTLAQLVVVPLPPDLAGQLLTGIGRAGAAGSTLPVDTGQAAALTSPLLSIGVVQGPDRGFAVAGLVPPDVLARAVAEVAPATRSTS